MAVPMEKKVRGDGLEINVAIWEGTGRPVICVHGITANCRSWDVLAAALSPSHRLIAMDLRGRGRSDKPSEGYSMEHHIRDIHHLMDDMGIERAVLMGHSLGAFISLVFSAEYPDRVDRIILVDGAGVLTQEQFDHVFAAIKPALDRLGKIYPSAEIYIEQMKAPPYVHPWSPEIETYYRYELMEVEGGVKCNIDSAHIQEESANVRKVKPDAYYPRIGCPALILRATEGLLSENDLLLPEPVVTRMVEEIHTAERYNVQGMNHYGIIFQPHPGRDQKILEFLKT